MLWPKRLLIFEDRIETRGTELLRETVETTRYSDIKGIVIGGRAPSTSLLIKHKGKPILLRGVEESTAAYAKTLIEERMSHAVDSLPQRSLNVREDEHERADLIRKLAELRDAGVLSPEEFETKKRVVEEK